MKHKINAASRAGKCDNAKTLDLAVKRHILYMIVAIATSFHCGRASAAPYLIPSLAAANCPNDKNMFTYNGYCMSSIPSSNYANPGQHFKSETMNTDGSSAFLPDGDYEFDVYTCAGKIGVLYNCHDGSEVWIKSNTLHFDGHTKIDNLNKLFSWSDQKQLTSVSSYCIAVTNTTDNSEWKLHTNQPWCTEGRVMPTTPSTCQFSTAEMNVKFGELERADIATSAEAGANSKTETASVDCAGDSDVIDVTTKFIYTTKLIGDAKAVSIADNEDLGVAITYKGKVVSPDESYTDTLSKGSNSIELGFEVIRDPKVELREIKTGEFSASAVMQMTIQ